MRRILLLGFFLIACGDGRLSPQGGTITGATPNGGLVVTSGRLGLLTSCADGEVPTWNNGTSTWECGTAGSSFSTNNVIPKGDGVGMVDSLLTDNATTLNYNAGKFTVAASDGDTVVAGTLEVQGSSLWLGNDWLTGHVNITGDTVVYSEASGVGFTFYVEQEGPATADREAGVFLNSSDYDTTSGPLNAIGVEGRFFGTHAAGAAPLTGYGGVFWSEGADVNIALETRSGNVVLNNDGGTGGTTTIKGATAIGDNAADAHSLTGTLNANSTAGSNGEILTIVSGVPKWATPASTISGLTSGRSVRATSSTTIGNGAFTDDGTNAYLGSGTFVAGATGGITKTGFSHEFTKNASNAVVSSSYGTGVVSEFMTFRGRGTAASTTAVQTNDILGSFSFTGAQSSTAILSGAYIRGVATENWSTAASGTKFEFYTTANTTTTRTLRLTIDNDGTSTFANNVAVNGNFTSGDASGDVFDHNGTLAKFGAASDGYTYISEDTLNYGYAQNGTYTGYINYYGYAGGTTQFRNLIIADGKNATACTLTGSTKTLNCVGGLQVNGTSVATTSSISGTSGRSTRFTGTNTVGSGAFTDDGTNASIDGSLIAYAGLTVDASVSALVAPELDWHAYNGGWAIGIDVANTTAARDFVLAAQRGTFSCGDAVINGTTTITSAAECGFSAALIGKTITGTNIPGGTTISAVASANSATLSASATGSGTIRATITSSDTADIIYLKHRGGLPPTVGFGYTPPPTSHRVSIAASDNENTMGNLLLRVGPSQTGNVINVNDSGGTALLTVTKNGYLQAGSGLGMVVAKPAAGTDYPFAMHNSTSTVGYGFKYDGAHGGTNSINFRALDGGVNVWEADTSGNFYVLQNAQFDNDLTINGSVTLGDSGSDGVTITGGLGVGNGMSVNLITSLSITDDLFISSRGGGNGTIYMDADYIEIGATTAGAGVGALGDGNVRIHGTLSVDGVITSASPYEGTHQELINEEWLNEGVANGGYYGPWQCVSSGTSAACANGGGASTGDRPGVQEYTTGSTSTGNVSMYIQRGAVWFGNGTWTWEDVVGFPNLSTSSEEFALVDGYIDAASSLNQTDGCAFAYDRAGTMTDPTTGDATGTPGDFWQIWCYSNGTRTGYKLDTTSNAEDSFARVISAVGAVTWSTNTNVYRLKIVYDGTKAHFYINGVEVGRITSNLPTGTGRITGIGRNLIKSVGSTARKVQFDYTRLAVDLNTARSP